MRSVLALACLVLVPVPASADEMCPGCTGSGTVGCPACAEPFGQIWKGKCAGCQGWYAQNQGRNCTRCNNTGTCQPCGGKGASCMPCKGSGRVPDGTGAAIRADRLKKAKERSASALGKLDFLMGNWKGRGVDPEQKEYSDHSTWEKTLDDWFRCSVSRTTKEGKTSESVGYLLYSFASEEYVYYLFFDRGNALMLKGSEGENGGSFLFPFEGAEGASMRWVLVLDPDAGKIYTGIQQSGDEGWQTTGEDAAERAQEKAQPSKSEPGKGLKNWSGLLGSWEAESKYDGKVDQSQYTVESVLGGNWFRFRGKNGSGEFHGMLTMQGDRFQYLVFRGASGEVMVYTGAAKDERTIEFHPQGQEGIRWAWRIESGRVRGSVEIDGKVVEESEALRK